MPGGQPLVLVEHFVRVARELLVRVEVLAQLLHEALHQGGERKRVLHPGLGVHHANLDGPEVRVWPHVVPEIGVVLDRAGLDHELHPPGVVLEVVVTRRDAHPREGAEDRRAGGVQPGGIGSPEGRVGRQREQHPHVHPHAVRHVDGLVGVVHPHVHVHAEDQLLTRHEAQRRHEVAIARPRHDALVLPHGEGVRARRTNGEPTVASQGRYRRAQVSQLPAGLLDLGVGLSSSRKRGDCRGHGHNNSDASSCNARDQSAFPPSGKPAHPPTKPAPRGASAHPLSPW